MFYYSLHKFLANRFFLSFFTLPVCIFFTAGLESRPVDDVKIVIFATGSLNGNFEPDRLGQGGLAALHTCIEKTRKEMDETNGGVILLHTGSFTGTNDSQKFKNAVSGKEFNLFHYMKYDYILPGNDEKPLKDLPVLPANTPAKNKKDIQVSSGELEIRGVKINFFNMKQEKETASLSKVMMKQTADLQVLLSNADGENLFADQVYREDLPEKEEMPQKTIIFQSLGSQDYFIRSESGSYICNTGSLNICRVELIFRSGHIISVQQKFFRVNDRSIPMSSYPADQKITDFLNSGISVK